MCSCELKRFTLWILSSLVKGAWDPSVPEASQLKSQLLRVDLLQPQSWHFYHRKHSSIYEIWNNCVNVESSWIPCAQTQTGNNTVGTLQSDHSPREMPWGGHYEFKFTSASHGFRVSCQWKEYLLIPFTFCLFFFKTASLHVAHDGLSFWSFCLRLPRADIIGTSHGAWLIYTYFWIFKMLARHGDRPLKHSWWRTNTHIHMQVHTRAGDGSVGKGSLCLHGRCEFRSAALL